MPEAKTYLPEVYEAVNRALRTAAQAAGATVVTIGHPENGDTPMPSCGVRWLELARRNGSEMVSQVQLDIWQTGGNMAAALSLAEKWGRALAILPDDGCMASVRVETPTQHLTTVYFSQLEQGWVNVPDVKPSVTHLSLTLVVRWKPEGLSA